MNKRKKVTELDLYIPVYKVTTLVTEMTQRFPKCYKTNIADSIIHKMIECCDLLVMQTFGEDASLKLQQNICSVQILLRLCVDLKIISVGKFAEIVIIIDEINNILNPEAGSLI